MQAGSTEAQGIAGALNLRHYFRVVWVRKWLILAIAVVTVASAWVFVSRQEPLFLATAMVMIEPEAPRVVNIQDVAPGVGSPVEYYLTQIRVIRSRPIADATIKRHKLNERVPALAASSDPGSLFQARSYVEPVRGTRLVAVGFYDPDRALAAEVANALASEYVRYNLELKHRTAQDALVWLNEQIGELRDKAAKSSAAVLAHQARADLLGLQEQRQLTQSKIMDATRGYQEAQNARLTLESKLRELRDVAKDPNAAESILRVADDPLVHKLKAEASDLLGQRARMSQLYREKHPDLIVLDAQIKLANQRIQAELKNMLQSLETELKVARGREQALLGQVNELRREAHQLAAKETQARALDRERESTEQLHATVLKRLNETGLTTALDASNIRVVEAARPPWRPMYPRTQLIMILSVVAGLALGVGAAFVVDHLDDRVRSPEDVERVLGRPVLGVVPEFSPKRDA